jgi:hypothetical protein
MNKESNVSDTLAIGILIALGVGLVLRGYWRAYLRRVEQQEALHRLGSEAAAAAGVKYAHEHPREMQAALYCDGSAEDAASYRKGQRAAEKAAFEAALADPAEAIAAARWQESAAKIRKQGAKEPE